MLTPLVIGYNLVPEPPARTIPFIFDGLEKLHPRLRLLAGFVKIFLLGVAYRALLRRLRAYIFVSAD